MNALSFLSGNRKEGLIFVAEKELSIDVLVNASMCV